MQKQYREALAALNDRQRQAVETTDGPVLVIAGPGTGKTQLISTRVGYLMQNSDTPADAILLLTFTEAGVDAMRDRLSHLIGKAAYDVQLNTYHAFGGEIFRRYPDYFEGTELNLLEELSADSLLRNIIAKLPYSDPLKFADSYINDLKSFISEAKRALLSPDDIDEIAKANLNFISSINRSGRQTLNKLSIVSKKSVANFEDLLNLIRGYKTVELPDSVLPLAGYARDELEAAIDHFNGTTKTTLLTEWKRHWLARDAKGNLIFDGRRLNERLSSAAAIYRRYQRRLRQDKLYDYDDMIIRAIDALETNPELKYSLADRYSYIMLDEFQDTNPAQFRLVQLLTDHPVHEGRPNVLAVGDDDQAIYAFQGADHANMASFINHYRDVKVISLKENYRSTAPILDTSQNIVRQINSRLVNQFKNVTKNLTATVKETSAMALEVRQFKSDAAQYDWVAHQAASLIKGGIAADEIAILAPKHRYLEPILPYLSQYKLAVNYERRENILDEHLVHQLEQMSRLVLALSEGDERLSNYLWPEVLSYDFWDVATDKIWQLSWQSRQSLEPWTSIMLNDDQLKPVASFFIKLSSLIEIVPLEQQIDALIGLPGIDKALKLPINSPLYNYYFSGKASKKRPLEFSKLISDLSVVRSRLQQWRRSSDEPLGLKALVEFINGHRAAGLNILNTSPYHETENSVNVLTAYGAKGREFDTVFIIAANDEVWGSASRNQGYRLSLPANLDYIRYQGASEDERLRLLYVAATRAKTKLYFTGFSEDLAGRSFSLLKYMDITDESGQEAKVLPPKFQKIIQDKSDTISLAASENYWTRRHLPPFKPNLRQVLEPRLKNYKLSATDLNHFIDIIHYGPDDFFMRCLLRFPGAPAITDSFGTAVHSTLRFAGQILRNEGSLPDEERLVEIFQAQLGRIELPADEYENLALRGANSLRVWLAQRGADLHPSDQFEYDFQNEGSRISDVPLGGKVDRLITDEKRHAIIIVDYKTGRAYDRWQTGVPKLHLFQLQLMFYKLLIEGSARFRKYKVEKGIIEFVEPGEDGQIQQLELEFDKEQVEGMVKLIKSVWTSAQGLNFPDTSQYQPTLAGIRHFETDLVKKLAK